MTLEIFGSEVQQCSKTKAFLHGLSLHATALKNGMLSDLFISNHILNMHAKCGNINFARQLFDEMPQRNLVTWSAMISGYHHSHMPALAVQLFSKLRLKPNHYVFASVISACASLWALRLGEQVHAQAVKVGDVSVSFVSNSLVSMYMKCGRPSEAFSVFDGACELNVVSYNAVIAGFVENQERGRAFEAFRLMRLQGLVPDRFTFVAVLGLCTRAEEDVGGGMGLHCQTVKLKLDCSAFVGNVIMMMYSKFNMMEAAEEVFMAILEKDVISWNTFITACSHCDEFGKGLSMFGDMLSHDHVRPDNFTYASALSACAGVASAPQGKQIHTHLIRTRLDEDVGVGNALVNMYAKCGCIEYAYTLFQRRSSRNVVSWNSIINGFANHGLGQKAIQLFERMKDGGVKPDSVTFLGLLAACNHSGLVDQGQAYFKSMHEIYGIVPDIEHFSCLIDLLGRAGRLREAEEYIEKFSFGDDTVVLGCLLSACRLHGDVEIGERLARRLLKVQPVTSSPYILLSNLYASDEMWSGVVEARKLLKGSGLKKEPGYSLIEVKGTIEKFTVDQFSNSRIDEIVDVLKSLSPVVIEQSDIRAIL